MKKRQQIVREEKDRHYNYHLIEDETVLATFHGSVMKPRNDTLSLTKIEGDVNAIKTLGKEFFKICQAENLQIISNNLPEREEIVKFLFELGFKLKNRQVHYSLDLKEFEYKPVKPSPFVFKSMDTLDEDHFKDLLYSSIEGDPLQDFKSSNRDLFFEKSKNYPTFNSSHWLLAYLDNKPVGFILANLNPDYAPNVVAGHMEYFSILPAFRKQGFGAQLHYYAMSYLKELGAVVYHGNTSTKNQGMIRMFEKSGCKVTGPEFLFLRPK